VGGFWRASISLSLVNFVVQIKSVSPEPVVSRAPVFQQRDGMTGWDMRNMTGTLSCDAA
jgi:hypothetical protein